MGTTVSKDTQQKKKLPSIRSNSSYKHKSQEGDSVLDRITLSRKSSWRKSVYNTQDTSSSVSDDDPLPIKKNVPDFLPETKRISMNSLINDSHFWKKPRKPFSAYKGNDKEYERQLRQHYVLKHILQGNIHVPIPRDSSVIILENACGAGVWTLDMALEYPNAKFIGLEAFHERRELRNLMIGAPNIVYKLGDLVSHLQLPADSIDIVYQRDACLAIPQGSWPSVLAELKRVAKPGAYIELVENSFALCDPGPVLTLVNEYYENAARAFGVNPDEVRQVKTFLIQAGFTDVKEKVKQVPIGEWHKDQAQKENGFLLKQVFKSFYDSKRSWWASELKLPVAEYDKLTRAALNEIDGGKSYMECIIFTARKPI